MLVPLLPGVIGEGLLVPELPGVVVLGEVVLPEPMPPLVEPEVPAPVEPVALPVLLPELLPALRRQSSFAMPLSVSHLLVSLEDPAALLGLLLEVLGLLLEPVLGLVVLLLELGLVVSLVLGLALGLVVLLLPVAPVLPLEPDVCASVAAEILNSAAATAAPMTFMFIFTLLRRDGRKLQGHGEQAVCRPAYTRERLRRRCEAPFPGRYESGSGFRKEHPMPKATPRKSHGAGSNTNASDAVDNVPLRPGASLEEIVDAGVAQTFPASDPPAVQKAVETAHDKEKREGPQPASRELKHAPHPSPDWMLKRP